MMESLLKNNFLGEYFEHFSKVSMWLKLCDTFIKHLTPEEQYWKLLLQLPKQIIGKSMDDIISKHVSSVEKPDWKENICELKLMLVERYSKNNEVDHEGTKQIESNTKLCNDNKIMINQLNDLNNNITCLLKRVDS